MPRLRLVKLSKDRRFGQAEVGTRLGGFSGAGKARLAAEKFCVEMTWRNEPLH